MKMNKIVEDRKDHTMKEKDGGEWIRIEEEE